MRQGPFLLQPSPRSLEDSEGGDTTDIAYLSFLRDDDDEDAGATERLGIVIVTHQDGKVDVCLDVEKVEARWESKQVRYRNYSILLLMDATLGSVSGLAYASSLRVHRLGPDFNAETNVSFVVRHTHSRPPSSKPPCLIDGSDT